MKDLVFISNNQVVVSSRVVAERFKREHKNVLVGIRNILVAEKSATNFYREEAYKYRGRFFPEYYMNRDGFMLLVMGFNTAEAIQLKAKFINAFNEMEAKLKAQTPQIDVRALAEELKRELVPKAITSEQWEEHEKVMNNIQWFLKHIDKRGLIATEAFLRGYYR